MILHFGLALDGIAWPRPDYSPQPSLLLGPQGLLKWLETHLGLSAPARATDYLRLEQYRQALKLHLAAEPAAFYGVSFQADQFATAADLLTRRDELLLAGWNLAPEATLPPRLATLAAIEKQLQATTGISQGFAERFRTVEATLQHRSLPAFTLQLNDPLNFFPPHWQRLLHQLAQVQAIPIQNAPAWPTASPESDLGRFQTFLRKGVLPSSPAQGDGSILVLHDKRDADLAHFLAGLCRHNPGWCPTLLLPEGSRSLDNALIQEGLPSLGIQPASLARPTLQILKLATAFLWTPIDPYKILEFISLPLKPLDDELAYRIGQLMAQSPGLFSEGWHGMISQFFRELETNPPGGGRGGIGEIRQQYRFWFERNRYDPSSAAPQSEVKELFAYLAHWAQQAFRNHPEHPSLLVLAAQATQIAELVAALPETGLSRLELERIVRTVYEAAPARLAPQEVGSLPFVHQPHAFCGPVAELVWWNFVHNEPDYFFSRWYQAEERWLAQAGIALVGPREKNNLLNWQRRQPCLVAQQRLVLLLPATVEGQAVEPHPLLGDLEACFGHLTPLRFSATDSRLAQFFELPQRVELPWQPLGKPAPFLHLKRPERWAHWTGETFTSLNTLFYFPHQWLFRYRIKLRKSAILSIVEDQTLRGNLAHRLFQELLIQPNVQEWEKNQLEAWVAQTAQGLLHREGAVLLLYGREPERVGFIKKLQYAAWSMLNYLKNNGWTVLGTEEDLTGALGGLPLQARADLILARGSERAILDLKWRGSRYREQLIRNEEDLQLVLYARLAAAPDDWAHTAYFIMETGKLLARNQAAFQEVAALAPQSDHREINAKIWEKMAKTLAWRQEQLARGQVEVRCPATLPELEATYGSELLDLLEMKHDPAPYDDYRVLIQWLE